MNNGKNYEDFAYLPGKMVDCIKASYAKGMRNRELIGLVKDDIRQALSEKEAPRVTYKKNSMPVSCEEEADIIYIRTSVFKETGGAIIWMLTKNQGGGPSPWELTKVITEDQFSDPSYVELGKRPRDMLYKYARWPNITNDLKRLKNEIILKENWSYVKNPADDDFPILKSYIDYTFAKLWRSGQVIESIDGRYSAFNTGLVNKIYQYVYVLFKRIDAGPTLWEFLDFAVYGASYQGKILANHFPKLPSPARYFSEISDISYIISADKSTDDQLPELQPDHYFTERPERLPIHFLNDGCRKNEKLLDLLSRIEDPNIAKDTRERLWREIGDEIGKDMDVYNDLENSFRGAVRRAVMRVSWNYRTAIPVYFPKLDKMSILLPLSFSSKYDAEVALVVEKNDASSKYTAPTILSLAIAYSNARLVCKPESDWLNQRVFEPVSAEISGDEEGGIE